ncbi:hypothetical protein Nmel_001910 [Mimus melanotis]
MVWTPVPPCQISETAQIAQSVYFHVNPPSSFPQVGGNGGFDFTGKSQILWAQSISSHRPTFKSWPSHWPLTQAAKGLAGVGGLSIPKQCQFCHNRGP